MITVNRILVTHYKGIRIEMSNECFKAYDPYSSNVICKGYSHSDVSIWIDELLEWMNS